MVVYPDLAVIIGLIIHASVFRLAMKTLNLRRSLFEYIGFVLFSGLISGVTVIPIFPTIVFTLFCAMVFLIFLRGKTVLGTLRNFLCGILILLLYLGCFICISGLFFGLSCFFWNGAGYFLLSFGRTVISCVFAFVIIDIFVTKRKQKQIRKYCDCILWLEGKRIPFRSLVDTGNLLTDLLSGLPVVLMEYSLLRKYLGKNFPAPMTCEFAGHFAHRARVIPYRTVSGDGQMLSAFIAESFTVNGISKKAVIAVVDRPLESRGQYSGIVGPDFIGGE